MTHKSTQIGDTFTDVEGFVWVLRNPRSQRSWARYTSEYAAEIRTDKRTTHHTSADAHAARYEARTSERRAEVAALVTTAADIAPPVMPSTPAPEPPKPGSFKDKLNQTRPRTAQ